jgi:hypothetical protein
MQPCFFCDICKGSVAVVFVEPIRGAVGSASQPRPRQHKHIDPPIVIVINESAAASSGLYDVLFVFRVTIDHWLVQTRDSSDVHKMGVEGTSGSRGSGQRRGGVGRNTLRSQPVSAHKERDSHAKLDEPATAEIHGTKDPKSLSGRIADVITSDRRLNQRLARQPLGEGGSYLNSLGLTLKRRLNNVAQYGLEEKPEAKATQ